MKADRQSDFSTARFVVCVPVEQGAEPSVEITISSVVAHTAGNAQILIFSNAHGSFDAFTAGQRNVRVVRTNATPTLREIVENLPAEFSGFDLLVVRPGTDVPISWDARLKWTAYSDQRIATASPVCNEVPLFSILRDRLQESPDLETLNRIAYWKGRKLTYELPFFLPACVYIKREALHQLCSGEGNSVLDSAWQTSHALNSHGFLNVICDHVVIRATENDPSMLNLTSTDAVEVAHLLRHHPFGEIREAADEKLKRKTPLKAIPGLTDGTVQLHLMHGWGGGLEQWVRSYCKADTTRTNLILKPVGNWGSFGEALFLYENIDAKEPIARWDFTRPIRGTAITHFEYKHALAEILRKYGVDYILVSSLIGHSLDALKTDVDTALVCHDYHPFCPAITIHFNEVCTSCDCSRLTQCFQQNEMNRFFKNLSATEWIPLRQRFTEVVTERSIQVITPTDSVREHLVQLEPALQNAPFATIAHGMDCRSLIKRQNRSKPGERLRVVILGSLALQKGYNLFKATYRELLPYADIFLLGCGDEGMEFQGEGICVIRSYKPEELPHLLEKISPDCGLLLSIWPETFSYTLSELMQFGIPPVATNLGAFRNRVQNGINGLLFEPTPACLLQIIQSVHADRKTLEVIEAELLQMKHRSLAEMVEDYHVRLPEKRFSPVRYSNGDNVYDFASTTKKSLRRDLKKYMRQQVKTPTLLAMKRRIVRWLKISRTIPSR
ncbi:MAG: glycosyltransferase [Verrucomicrobia bacterium]|nr:glycosyltransferase [Verrucomicrobiota bacterium]